jgi:hypothetical protein
MTIAFDEINSLIGELKELDEQRKNLEKQGELVAKKIVSAFADHLNEIYRKWRPGIGERLVITDFRQTPPFSYEVIIENVDGNHCSFRQTLKPIGMTQAFFLDWDVHEYEAPVLTFPLFEFLNLKDKMNLKDYLPLR